MQTKIYMKTFKHLLLVFLLAVNLPAFAQQKEVITKIKEFKPPAVKTFLGINQNGAKVTTDEASQLLALPLKISDDKKNEYPVSSYRFLYRQKGYILNDETGKKEPTFTITADRFNSTPLPQTWIKSIRARLQPGEQLYFFDIIVKDKQGREFFAPELKITIQ